MQFDFEKSLSWDSLVEETSLHEGKDCEIVQAEGERKMILRGRWSKDTAGLASQYKITALMLSESYGWRSQPLSFLDQLPELQSLSVVTSENLDWRSVTKLRKLKSLTAFARGASPEPLDFSVLVELKECRITLWDAWASILEHPTVESLYVKDAKQDEVRVLAPLLKSLQLMECSKTTHLSGNALANLEGLEIAGCKRLVPDWSVLRNLRALRLDGKPGFPLDNLAMLPNLERLYLYEYGRLASVDFVSEIPSLALFRVGWKTKIDKEGWERLRAITKLQL